MQSSQVRYSFIILKVRSEWFLASLKTSAYLQNTSILLYMYYFQMTAQMSMR